MNLSKDSLKIFNLFGKERNRNYYAMHTLMNLYDNKKVKDFREIGKYLSDFSIHPYLMLKNLDDEKESKIIKLIFDTAIEPDFKGKNFSKDYIEKIENPSWDSDFMENLIHKITSEEENERFCEREKARKLFFLYGKKGHLKLMMNQLELYSRLYHNYKDCCLEGD